VLSIHRETAGHFSNEKGDWPANTPVQFPGVKINDWPTIVYSEGLNIGYRWYDAKGVKPRFAFGHGLSYTDFAISNLSVSPEVSDGTEPITVTAEVANTGDRAGAEVAQVYISMPSWLNQPPKRLVGFQKVTLEPGEKRKVSIVMDPKSSNHPLSTWNVAKQQWVTSPGEYILKLGNSSDALTMQKKITIVK